MNRKKLTEAVFRALKPVKEEEEEIEDVEVDVEDEVEIEEPTGAVVQSDSVARIQASLVDAIDAAQELGDEKLVTQIGNTITFLTRSQVRGAEAAVDESIDMKDIKDGDVVKQLHVVPFGSYGSEDEIKEKAGVIIGVTGNKVKVKNDKDGKDYTYDPADLVTVKQATADLMEGPKSRYSRLAEKVVSRIRESRK